MPAQRPVVEVVLRADGVVLQRVMAAPGQEPSGQVEVALAARDPGRLDQRRLDLGVPVDPRVVVAAERLDGVVGGGQRGRRQVVLGAAAQARHACLNQVAVAVQLEAVTEVGVLLPYSHTK
nr:hypothetical protein [Jiangella ureilytica]